MLSGCLKGGGEKMAIMRIVKNNNFSIVSNSIIGDKMSRKVGTKCPLTLGQNVPKKIERDRKSVV